MPTDPQNRATVTERMFPIQPQRGAPPHPLRIPWPVAKRAYSVYAGRYGRAQSLERLAERGGFGPGEMDNLLPGWRDLADACAEAVRGEREACAMLHESVPNECDRDLHKLTVTGCGCGAMEAVIAYRDAIRKRGER